MKKQIFLFLLVLLSAIANGQDSCQLRVSLLTCTPGAELYSIFGHSAMRVIDKSTGTDIVYNYGTFDFGDPSFYSKFIRGKLLYYLAQENTNDFMHNYVMENRGIDEQVLNLNCKQLAEIQQFLFINLRGDNIYYKYDFLIDNCTTRLRDIIEQKSEPGVKFGDIPEAKGMTIRDGIHYYQDKGKTPWSKLGLDLLMGSKIDRKMTNREAMFLPEFLEKSVDLTVVNQDSIVKEKLFPIVKVDNGDNETSFLPPAIFFSLLALAMSILGFMPQPLAQKILHFADIILFLCIGLMGCLLMFMWFGTDHRYTASNFNLAWAWPTHLVAAIMLIFRKKIIPNYFFAYSIVTLIVMLAWKILPQELNPSLLPLLAIAGWRSWNIEKQKLTSTI